MIYIPHIKDRLEKLASRWHEGKLNADELTEFYDLLDEVVLEAREGRSDFVSEDERPEIFLINLLQHRLKKTVIIFFLSHKRYFSEPTNYNTPHFKAWLEYAKSITESIILSDATERQTRRNKISKYLGPFPDHSTAEDQICRSKKDFINDRHLHVNSKRLFARKKELLRQQDNIADWNYLPWAEQCALNEGVGYNPDYKKDILEDLALRLEAAEDLTKRWEADEFREDIKTRDKLNNYLRSKYTSFLPSEIKRKIESLKERMPNLVNFLFGSKKRKGELFWRLTELFRFINNRNDKEICCDNFQHLCDVNDYERFVIEDIEEEINSDTELDTDEIAKKLKQFGLTNKQVPIFIMRIIEKRSPSSIASALGISKRAVYKHLVNIIQNPTLKQMLPTK